MRVAIVCPYAFDAHGGVQDQVESLVRWLGENGHEAWAVAPGEAGPPGTRHVGRFVSWRANRSRAPIALGPGVRRRVRAAIADADVVHIHEPLMPMVSLAASLSSPRPTVGTFHADAGRLARSVYRVMGPLVRRALHRLGVVTAVSPVAASVLGARVDVRIVPNGIDLEPYRSGDVARVPGRVVFVGRDDARKGLDVLLDAWAQVRRDHPEAELRVVGADRSDAPADVIFLGRVDDDRKVTELRSAQVLVAPNRGGESFGIVVLEGLAAGCAVVASDLSAFRAVAGDAARYVPVGDAGAVAAAIAGLLGDAAEMGNLGRRGVGRAADFGRERVLAAYLAAYSDAMNES